MIGQGRKLQVTRSITSTRGGGTGEDGRNLVGGFKDFLFSPLPGEDSQFDSYFSKGLKPPTRNFGFLSIPLVGVCRLIGVWKNHTESHRGVPHPKALFLQMSLKGKTKERGGTSSTKNHPNMSTCLKKKVIKHGFPIGFLDSS